MDFSFLSQINYLAVAVSSVVFFLLGSVWFSGLFGSIWQEELAQHNVVIQQPTSGSLMIKMLLTFCTNILASIAMAALVVITNSVSIESGLLLGLITTLGFAVTTLASVFVWESRSLKLFLLDIGYPVVGIITSSVILSLWR